MKKFETIKQVVPEIERLPKNDIELDEIAREYAERIRLWLFKLKNKYSADEHLKTIDPEKLTHDDLIVADKLRKEELTVEEYNEYHKIINEYCNELRAKGASERDILNDSRKSLEGWIGNEVLNLLAKKRHPERYKQREIDKDKIDLF